jgi:regulator of protease activity HflC (stomatin/prohibitin superfamily)
MSTWNPLPLRDPELPGESGGELTPAPAPRRAGSFTIRDGSTSTQKDESPLDPANQSLADALRIMLGLLQIAMFILGGVYCVSGLQSVKEGERGIRLLFGKRQGDVVDPGLQISAPYPLGELLTVKQGLRDIAIDKDFWVYVPDSTPEGTSVEKLMPTQSLKPDQGGSGSVLTADGNIAHTKWRVGYRREEVANYAQNVLPEDEELLVRAAVKRGVVQACAQVTIDELLKQSSSQTASLASRAKAVAQRTLDSFQSGLTIDQLTLDQTIPPLWVRSDFAKVQSAVSDAAKAVDTARNDGQNRLNSIAGEAVPMLIKAINQYEAAIAKDDKKAMDEGLATIDKLLLGDKVMIDGQELQPRISGQVTTTLAEAKRDRAASVTRAKTALARFEAKLSQYNENPAVMVQQEWSNALRTFMGKDNIQIVYTPTNMTALRLLINADPDLLRDIDVKLKTKESEKSERERMKKLQEERFKTNTATEGEQV